MSKVKTLLNEQFYTALGITPYLLRPDFQPPTIPSNEADLTLPSEKEESDQLAVSESIEQAHTFLSDEVPKNNENARIPSPEPDHTQIEASEVAENIVESSVFAAEGSVSSVSEGMIHWIVLGEGLGDVWQSEGSRQWRLWQNILQVWGLSDSATQFIDTQPMMDEARIEALLDSVSETGAEVALVFESSLTHPLVEMLSEGMEVIVIPSLMDMLESGHAKQRFYQTLVEANQHLPGLLPRTF